jgi:hypothetical protein
MKQLFTLLIGICVCTLAPGQNNLFIPFGQTAEQVTDFLGSRDYVHNVHIDSEMKSVRADLDQNKKVEYAFENGSLYATTVTRSYENRRVSHEVQRNCLEYMNVISRGTVSTSSQQNVVCHTAVTESRVIKLFVASHKGGQTLTLTAVSRHHGPMIHDKDFYYEVELLQNKFISNR